MMTGTRKYENSTHLACIADTASKGSKSHLMNIGLPMYIHNVQY